MEKLNSYINKGYNYFHAEESRELLNLISNIEALVNKFTKTSYEFIFDKEYLSIFQQCRTFVKNSGTKIPDDFKPIDIIYRPIFILSNTYFEKSLKRQYKLTMIGQGAFADVLSIMIMNINIIL